MNLQNIPAGEAHRYCFDSPNGWRIVNADYAGQESIVLANKCMDSVLISFYLEGDGDLHAYVATKMFRIINNDPDLYVPPKELPDGSDNPEFTSEHKKMRNKAKSLNFALAYGASAYSIKDTLGVSEAEAQEFIDIYFKAFPGLNDYFQRGAKRALRNGWILIDPITMRRSWFDGFDTMKSAQESKNWSRYFSYKGSLERNSQNYPIQGTAGSITKLASIKFRSWINKHNLWNSVLVSNVIHDEINVECREEIAEQVARALEVCMENAGKPWCKVVPLKAKAVVTDHWQH